ncbi:flagellar biosynthetic protein FliO [Couchioplanes caeruleus]|uniref:Flagellar protein n=2 Tax=Couchioplanes caeruleus TaxID=56438 RepID=A0A1K0GCH7_9ACTN|nr:flagellar biosynthetic protein FliO [Couchioplanes caeruleus]OJF09870.1 flagellar biosynthetic protein FliO [Couchioplanes caeruleus subsp. caeruleus]ROP31716.1 flagellar protein FliO/FliZ [Couchioplanes caeruleus]
MFELVLRIGFSLLVVFGLMWGLARVARRGGVGRRGHGNLSILNRQSLSRGSSVAVVRVADKALILGVTDNQVSLLGETELAAFAHEPHAVPATNRTHDAVTVGPNDVLPSAHPTVLPHHGGKLEGSILSPRTWTSTLDFLRDRTARH